MPTIQNKLIEEYIDRVTGYLASVMIEIEALEEEVQERRPEDCDKTLQNSVDD